MAAVTLAAEPAADPELSPVQRVDQQLLRDFLADPSTLTLIDARSPEEFAKQHLPGAINLPFDSVDDFVAVLPEDNSQPIIIYCRTGRRSGLLQAELIERGYTDVRVLPREQIFWNESVMVFDHGADKAKPPATTVTPDVIDDPASAD